MAIKMQIRRGTLTAWASADPTLVAGELGFVTDAGKTAFKIGDGTNTWTTLPYVNSTYPELLPDAGGNLDLATVQGRYPLLNASTYTNDPSEFSGGATDGDSVLMVTVPASGIVIQELTTSKTSKRWIRGKNAGTWSAWQRLHGVIATDSLTVVNLTATGTVVANQLGVGVSSPQAKVHVAVSNPTRGIVGIVTNTGTSSLTGSQIQITQNLIQDYVIGQPATVDALAVWRGRNTATDGTELVRLTSTALASNVNVTAPSIQAGATGLTSSGGLTVTSGNTSLVSLTCSSTASGITPTTANHFATKSYVDTAVIAGSNSVIVDTNAWVVTTTIPTGPTNYVINISTQLLGVEYVYYWSQGAYTTTGGARAANLQITTNAGIYAQYKSGYRHSAGTTGSNTATFGYSESPIYTGYVFQPSLTYTVATIVIAASSGGAVPNVNWGYITIKRIV